MNLEDELRRAFRCQPAPPDFADRVLARLERPDVLPAETAPPRVPARRWLVGVAASALLAIGGVQYIAHRQAIAEAERVQQEVRLALQIAGEKLALVQRKLQDPTR